MNPRTFTFVCLMILGIHTQLTAQWTTQTSVNTLVSSAPTDDIKAIGTPDGKTWIAYWKQVPAPAYFEMRAQLLSAGGDTLLGPEGVLVNSSVSMSSYTTIWTLASDEWSNLYVGFNGTASGNSVYFHKIDTSGNQLWGANGVSPGTGFDPKILPLLDGSAVVSWLPGNQGVMQKISSSGSLVWPVAVTIQPGISGHRSSAGEMLGHPNGDFTVLIHDRAGVSPSSYFYAQRYNSAGTAIWAAPIAISNIGTSYNRRYTAIAYQDTVYLGYSGAIGMVFHSYLQRINPGGTLPWGINGVDFSTQSTDYERDTKIAYSPGSNYIWAICEYTNSAQSISGEYLQKFDKVSGNRLLTNTAKQIFPISSNDNTHKGNLQLVQDQPLFLVSNGTNNGALPISLKGVLLDQNGNFVWPGQTADVATYSSFKSRVEFTLAVMGQSVAVWCENRGSGSRIYAQPLASCVGPTAGFAHTAAGKALTFNYSGNNADSVFWDFGDNSVGMGFNPTHLYQDTGYFQVCQIVKNSCGTDTLCLSVHVLCPLPIGNFTWSSSNLTAQFISNSTNADTIRWIFGDNGSATGNNVIHTYQDTGTYLVCMILSNACGSDTSCQIVIVQCPLPQAGFTYTTNGLSVMLQSASSGADTVYWDFGDGTSGGGDTLTHAFAGSGTYLVCLFGENECGIDTFCQSIQVSNIGIPEARFALNARVFPNPVKEKLYIEIDAYPTPRFDYQITDINGRVVKSGSTSNASLTYGIDVNALAPGMYQIGIELEGKRGSWRFCVRE